MAIQQVDSLQLGPVVPGSAAASAQLFSSTATMGVYSAAVSYSVNNTVEFSGQIWRSLSGSNLNNTPSTSSTFWQLILPSVKDGDVCVVVSGALSDIMIRKNGIWTSATNVPFSVSLPNNVTGQIALQFPLSVARAATLQYSITNNGIYRTGTLRWNSDGTVGPTGVNLADLNNVDIDGDCGITFDAQVDGTGTIVQILYSSTNLSATPAAMQYTIQGWT